MSKIVFFGTPEFSVPSLELICKSGHTVSLVVCQPDKKKGRGLQMISSPVKQYALTKNLPLYQPKSLSGEEATLRLSQEKADFFIVIAYGRFLPDSILQLPTQNCINAHPSLLPEFRGPSPIQYAIMEGNNKTGVCTMLISAEMDEGDILLSQEIPINPGEKYDSLSSRLSQVCAEMLVETVKNFQNITPQAQNSKEVTFCKLIGEKDRHIDWGLSEDQIFNRYRALCPIPGIFSFFRGKRLLIKDLQSPKEDPPLKPQKYGTIISVEASKIRIACHGGSIDITSVQPENKKEISVKDWINGYQIKTGEVLD